MNKHPSLVWGKAEAVRAGCLEEVDCLLGSRSRKMSVRRGLLGIQCFSRGLGGRGWPQPCILDCHAWLRVRCLWRWVSHSSVLR